MPPPELVRSNRAEALVDALARVLSVPLADPFAKECLVVQGRGMERWLSHELAARLGVFAHGEFPFPRAFLERALSTVLGEGPDAGDAWAPEVLALAIADLLPGCLDDERFAPIRRYLRSELRSELQSDLHSDLSSEAHAQGAGDGKLFALAERIAETFDQYAVYRPELVLAWERGDLNASRRFGGDESPWQRELWRALVARLGDGHLAARIERLVRALAAGSEPSGALPERACLFGLSTLPPLFVRALAALASRVELHVFVLSPSREYWADIRSRREQERIRRRAGGGGQGAFDPLGDDDLHLEEGHALLASLGRVGRDFQQVVEDVLGYVESAGDLYLDPASPEPREGTRLLHAIQSDILSLRARGGPDASEPPLVLAHDDRSLTIHACHGPMREAEVLRDQLLDCFAKDPTLEPHDVIVLSPDVARYAPFVEAAFSSGGDAALSIPLRVADRGARESLGFVDAFARALDVLDSRLTAGDVQELLACAAVRARFAIEPDDEALIHAWLEASAVRWGLDAAHRARVGQPADASNTWRFGLDRLFAGVAIEDAPGRLFGEVVPVPGIEGGETLVLGRLAELLEAIAELAARALEPRPLAEWTAFFRELERRLLLADAEQQHERRVVLDSIDALAAAAERAGHRGAVGFPIARELIGGRFARAVSTGGFLTGAVTLCELRPMRSIPFRVVALLGLSDTAFPRQARRAGFDLMAAHRRLGDRSVRDDDRQLFLETILSARDRLIVSYVGRDIGDNEKRPPSVAIDELLDHVARGFRPSARDAAAVAVWEEDASAWAREHLVVHHRLQPWSPEYFADPDPDAKLFSYSRAWAGAVARLAERGAAPPRFVAEPLAPVDESDGLALERLLAYFRHPARFLVSEQLRIRLDEAEEIGPEREPLDVESLDAVRVGHELVEVALAGADPEATFRRVAGRGLLPLGAAGRSAHAEIAAEAAAIARAVRLARGGDEAQDLEIDVACAGTRIRGRLTGLHRGGRVVYRYAKLGYASELEAWVAHVLLCAAARPGQARPTHVIGRVAGAKDDRHIRFEPVDDAEAVLGELVEIYRVGCTRPLPLFPRASRRYAEDAVGHDGDPAKLEQATLDAHDDFTSDDRGRAEANDPYVRQLFDGIDPLAPDHRPPGLEHDASFGFRSLAQRVFGPLLAARTPIS